MKSTKQAWDRPALLCALAMLTWGAMIDMEWLGLLCSIPLFLTVFVPFQAKVNERQLQSLAEFSFVVLLVGFILFSNNVDKSINAVILSIKWLPMFFYPLALCRFGGGTKIVSLKTLFVPFRYRALGMLKYGNEQLDLAWIFSFMLILSASASVPGREEFYYPAVCIWVLLALSLCSPRQAPKFTRALAITLALSLGYGIHVGLHQTEDYLTKQSLKWLNQSGTQEGLLKQSTMLGQTATLQQSEKILLRYQGPENSQRLFYMRSSTFDQLISNDTWFNSADAVEIFPMGSKQAWYERSHATDNMNRNLSQKVDAVLWMETTGNNWLPLATSTAFYKSPNITKHERVGKDSIRIITEENVIKVEFQNLNIPQGQIEPNIDTTDLVLEDKLKERFQNVPDKEIPNLEKFLALHQIDPHTRLEDLCREFKTVFSNYTYSLQLESSSDGMTPLGHFLLNSKSGHCEYYATATVLLLRQCGQLARYCQGFVMHEQDGDWRIARGQDAHAWAEVWDGKSWTIVETTPAADMPVSMARPLKDLWSDFMFWIDQLRFDGEEDRLLQLAPWILSVVLIYFSWRLFQEWFRHRKRKTDVQANNSESQHIADPGFQQLEVQLTKLGYPRQSSETWKQWQARMLKERGTMIFKPEVIQAWEQWAWDREAVVNETMIRCLQQAHAELEQLKAKKK